MKITNTSLGSVEYDLMEQVLDILFLKDLGLNFKDLFIKLKESIENVLFKKGSNFMYFCNRVESH